MTSIRRSAILRVGVKSIFLEAEFRSDNLLVAAIIQQSCENWERNIALVMVQYNCFSPLLNINHGFE